MKEEAEATLKSARRLPPIVQLRPASKGNFGGGPTAKTYSIPRDGQLVIDTHGLTNAKREAKKALLPKQRYKQAVKTQLISGRRPISTTLLMLDSQYEVTEETDAK